LAHKTGEDQPIHAPGTRQATDCNQQGACEEGHSMPKARNGAAELTARTQAAA